MNQHFIRYTRPTFREVARQAGLRIQEERYLYHWTCPVKLGIGIRERLFRIQPKPAQVPMWAINESMYFLSRLEQRTLTPLSLPFGSSLLVVGTKAST
jgi:hypothetical protein